MRCDIVVGGTDKGYIRTLVQFLLESNLNQFNLTIIDTSDALRDAFCHTNYSLFLIEEPLILPVISDMSEEALKHVLVLTEPLTQLDTQLVQPILKYQKASNIEQVLIDHFHLLTTRELVSETSNKGRMVSFYSPIGGVGTTTMAQIFAQIKSSKGYKVLLMSFEAHPNYELFYKSAQAHNMSDYMVYMLSHSNWLLGLERMVSVDVRTGVHYLKPVVHSKDLAEFEVGLWPKWCTYTARNGDYDYLVLDIGKALYKDGLALLEASHHNIFLTDGSVLAHYKYQSFSKAMVQLNLEDLLINKTLICNQTRAREICEENYDGLFNYDDALVKEGKEGELTLNPYGSVYRQMEALVHHV